MQLGWLLALQAACEQGSGYREREMGFSSRVTAGPASCEPPVLPECRSVLPKQLLRRFPAFPHRSHTKHTMQLWLGAGHLPAFQAERARKDDTQTLPVLIQTRSQAKADVPKRWPAAGQELSPRCGLAAPAPGALAACPALPAPHVCPGSASWHRAWAGQSMEEQTGLE